MDTKIAPLNPLNYLNRLEGNLFIWSIIETVNFCSNEVCGCKLKEIGNHFKNNEKMPGNLLKNLEKSWKSHGILSVRKSGNPEINPYTSDQNQIEVACGVLPQ